MKKLILPLTFVLFISIIFLFAYSKFYNIKYLTFSDSAKSADIARSIISGLGYNGRFSFWSSGIQDLSQQAVFPSPWLPPLMPYSIALSFILFGVSDLSAILTSSFYYLFLVIFTFLLGRKVFNNLTGVLSAIAVAGSVDFLNYATNSSTEALFSLEIVLSAYLISLKSKKASLLALVIMILSYFTRPQAFIYIAGLLLYYLLLNFKLKKAIIIFTISMIVGFLIDYRVLPNFAGKHFLYSVTGRGISTATQIVAGGSASDSLRGEVVVVSGFSVVAKKLFYNLYNYYKLLPQILSPYLFAFFVLGIFIKSNDKDRNNLKISTIFMFIVTIFVSALSIPFFRYIHPVVPLIYLLSVGVLVDISKNRYIAVFLILIFILGQTLGVIFLDSRFTKNTKNVGKPPVYSILAEKLKEDTKPTDFVVTNLDTWGSWYGERRTIWFPVDPKMLIEKDTNDTHFDVIYLTSYLMNDQNYYMGESWREIFDNPKTQTILPQYKFVKEYEIKFSENYERLDARGVLLIKK